MCQREGPKTEVGCCVRDTVEAKLDRVNGLVDLDFSESGSSQQIVRYLANELTRTLPPLPRRQYSPQSSHPRQFLRFVVY